MLSRNFRLHDGESGSALAVRLIPRSKDNQIAKVLDDGTIEIRLASSRPDLNKPLREYLSQVLGVREKKINVVAGKTRQEKLVSILDMKPDDVQEIIIERLS